MIFMKFGHEKVVRSKPDQPAGGAGPVLDTGCKRTMVRQDLVPQEKILEGDVATIRCAHGDTVLYPLANI